MFWSKHAYSPNIQETKAGGPRVQDQPGLRTWKVPSQLGIPSEILSQDNIVTSTAI